LREDELSEKPTMRPSQRLIAAAVLIALSSALAGCSSLYSWDPSDVFDWLDTKKKLPGERKPVFPDGVPGLEQGVPKDLYKGNVEQQQQQQADQAAQAAAAAPPPEEPKSKHAAKSRGKGKPPATAATEPAAAPDPDAAPEEDSTPAAPPAPKPKKIVRKRTTAPPPDQTDAQPVQPARSAQSAQQPQPSGAPFPAPLPSGTFTR
jgi:hypothetical protein